MALFHPQEQTLPAIKRLTPETSGKIAAGEVVERPVNALKELIENAIDASATRIDISIDKGGKELIRISDNGTGIPSAELPLAVENYSTSKIKSIDDLSVVRTLGFRGEALASIRSVSRLTISSRAVDEDVGREMVWLGEEVTTDSPVARPPGTEISVEGLFFNFPARMKFLSSDAAEQRRIISMVQSFALAFPDIAFTVKTDGKDNLSYPASSLDERVEVVFGSSAFPNLSRFDKQDGTCRVSGYTSLPGLTRGNRSFQFFFVNDRLVRDRMISHALKQAYHSIIPSDRFPLAVIFIELPAGEIDVNVHPTKAEIRFQKEREVHRAVTGAVRDALGGKTISFRDKVESVYRSIFPGTGTAPGRAGDALEPSSRRDDRGQPDLALETPGPPSDWLFQKSPRPLFEDDEEPSRKSEPGRLYWQLHQSYIFIQIRGGVVIIDQHAAHERILYNRIKNNIAGDKPVIQSLLFPATIELSAEEFGNYEKLAEVIASAGFEVEPFGPRALIVRAIPAGVKNWKDGELLLEMLSEDDTGKGGVEGFMRSYACKGAVKAGEKLSIEEMESLTDQLFATEFPFTCPHGRPTMLRVDMADLERRFLRTVKGEK